MIKSSEKILADIDSTLDQLIRNAQLLRTVSIKTVPENEVEALHKTQESLMAHLIHMDELLEGKKVQKLKHENFGQKIQQFSRMNAKLMENVTKRFSKKPRVGRNRKKKLKAR